MSNYFLYPVLELQNFIILSLGVLFLCTLVSFYFMGKRKKGLKDFGMQALFLGLNKREILLIALHLTQICFVFSVALFRPPAEAVQIAVFGIFCILRGLLEFSLVGIGRELVYGAMMGTALAVGSLLRDYMEETGVEFYMAFIWALLCLFILQYSVYYFLKSLERMLQRHEKSREKQKQKHQEA